MGALTVELPDEVIARLDALAQTTHQPKSGCVREALENHLDQVEWEQEVLRDARDIRSGQLATIPAAEARRLLELDN